VIERWPFIVSKTWLHYSALLVVCIYPGLALKLIYLIGIATSFDSCFHVTFFAYPPTMPAFDFPAIAVTLNFLTLIIFFSGNYYSG